MLPLSLLKRLVVGDGLSGIIFYFFSSTVVLSLDHRTKGMLL